MVCGSDVIGSACENQVILGDNTVTCRSGNVKGSPLPFKVRSDLEKITASILLSSTAAYSPPLLRVLVVPEAVVIKTLSASRT